jgi:hypothetical protein
MFRRASHAAIALALLLASGVAFAQPALSPPASTRFATSVEDWTVLTMAPDGAWGVATDEWINVAIARAISACKKMSRTELGCGAMFSSIRAGWSLGIRCGDENIVVAERTLRDAEQAAIVREKALRGLYVPHMARCQRVVTVNPRGAVVDTAAGVASQVDMRP